MTASPSDNFPHSYPSEFYSDATAAPVEYDDNVLPITEFPGYVPEPGDEFEPVAAPSTEYFPNPTFQDTATEHATPLPQPRPVVEPVANAFAPTPVEEAPVSAPAPAENAPRPPAPDWYENLSLTDITDLTMLLRDMDSIHHKEADAPDQADVVYGLRQFMKEQGLTRSDFAALLESKNWHGPTDIKILNSLPKRRLKRPSGRSKAQTSEENTPIDTDNNPDANLPVEIDPESGKVTSYLDFLKVANKAQRDEIAMRLGLDKTVRIGNLEIKRGRLIGGILGAVAVGATAMTIITLLRHGDTSSLQATTGGTGGGGVDPTQAHGHGSGHSTSSALPTTTEAAPTSSSAPNTTSSSVDTTTTTTGTTTPTTSSPVDTPPSSPSDPSIPDVPAGPDAAPAPSPSTHVTVEVGDTTYGLGHEQGLTDTQIANGINDGSIKAFDAQGHQVNVNDIQAGGSVDFNVDTASAPTPTPNAPVQPPVDVQPDVPAGSESVHMKQGGTLSDSVQDWMGQHGKSGTLHDATQAVIDYNRSLGIDLDWDTAHNLHSTNIGGQDLATLNGQPIQMPPEAMFDQLMDAIERQAADN
jgi:hypothetical protein